MADNNFEVPEEFKLQPLENNFSGFTEGRRRREQYENSDQYIKDLKAERHENNFAQLAEDETRNIAEDKPGLMDGIVNFGKHMGIGVAKGVEEAGETISDVGESLGMKEFVPNNAFNLQKPKTTAESLAQGFGQFLPLFIPSNIALSAALRASSFFGKSAQLTKAGQIVSGMAAGAVSDFGGFDPKDPNVSNFLLNIGAISKDSAAGAALKNYLAQDDSDPRLKARLKNAASGVIAGAVLDQLFRAAGGTIKGLRGKKGEKVPEEELKLDEDIDTNIYGDEEFGVAPTENPLFSIDESIPQKYSSADTSINKSKASAVVGKVAKSKKHGWVKGGKNFDIGGGKHDFTTNTLKKHGVENIVYDPFNRDLAFNKASVAKGASGQSDTATISNVLNVIEEDAVRLKILQQANDALKDDGKLYITVFEGNKSGVGEPTTKGYQLNKPLSEYLEEVKKVFPNANISEGMIVATKQVDNTLFDALKGGAREFLDGTDKVKAENPDTIHKMQEGLPSDEAAITDQMKKLEDDFLRPFEQLIPEKQAEVIEIVTKWARGDRIDDIDLSSIESMNFLKMEDDIDVANLLQFLSQKLEIKKLTKPSVKTKDLDTESGLEEMFDLDAGAAPAIISKHAGNVREAIRYVGAARALSSAFIRKAEQNFTLYASNGAEEAYDEAVKNTKFAYDMLVAGGELSKSSSDLLRSHQKLVSRRDDIDELRFFARESIVKQSPEIRMKQAGWFGVRKNVDELELEAKFAGGPKRKVKVSKKELLKTEQEKSRAKFEKLSAKLRKLQEEDNKKVATATKKQAELNEVGISRLQGEIKRLQKLKRGKGKKALNTQARIKALNIELNELLLARKQGITPEQRTKIVRTDEEKKIIASIQREKEHLGILEKKGLSDEELRSLAISKAKQHEIKDLQSANIRQVKARLNSMNKSFKARTRDAGLEVYINGLLSSVKTTEINFLGNMTAIFTSVIDRAYAGGVKGGGEVSFKEATHLMWGYMSQLPELFTIINKAHKLSPNKNIKQDFINPRDRAISKEAFQMGGNTGKAIDLLGTVVNIPGRLLLTADEVFKTFNYRAETRALAYRKAYNNNGGAGASVADKMKIKSEFDDIMKNVEAHDDIVEAANGFAAKNTYTNKLSDHEVKDPITGKSKVELGLGNRLKAILDTDKTGLARVFIPFFQTPANLLNFAWERTPIIRRLHRGLKSELSGELGEAVKELAEAKVATSRVMWATMFGAAWTGNFTGAPPLDPNLRKTLEADMGGAHWYSFNMGDGWRKYDRFDPLGVMMAASSNLAIMMKASVNLAQQYEEGDPSDEIFDKAKDVLEAGVIGTSKLLTDRHYLQGFAELINIFTGDHKGLSKLRPFGQKVASAIDPRTSFYSSIRRNVTRGFETEKLGRLQRTDMESMSDLTKEIGLLFEENLRNVTPGYGVRKASRNLVGDAVLHPGLNHEIDRQPFQIVKNFVTSVFNPSPALDRSSSPLIRKLAELESTQGQPSSVNKLNGITLTDDEKDFFITEWTKRNKLLNKVAGSSGFNKLPEGTQRFMLENAIMANKLKAKKLTMVRFDRLIQGSFDNKRYDMLKKVTPNVAKGFNFPNLQPQGQ